MIKRGVGEDMGAGRLDGLAMDADQIASLRQVPIFSMLEPAHLAGLARMTHRQHYRRGQIIYYRGDPGNAVYLLLSGTVKMTLPSETTGSDVLVALLHPGEHFGELAVLDGRPRWVTAVAAVIADIVRRAVVPVLVAKCATSEDDPASQGRSKAGVFEPALFNYPLLLNPAGALVFRRAGIL